MRKSTGYKQLSLVFCGKFNGYVLAVCRGTCADVNSYIQNATGQHANKLRLGIFTFLKVKSSEYAVARKRFVVLDKICTNAKVGKNFGIV